jgi:hypothetical protein
MNGRRGSSTLGVDLAVAALFALIEGWSGACGSGHSKRVTW